MILTSYYAAILALLFIFFSVKVMLLRCKNKIPLGDGENPLLTCAIRAHGNFAEYVPFALLLIYFVELQTKSIICIHILGILLLLSRVFHAYGIHKEKPICRAFGIISSLIVIGFCAISLIFNNISYTI